MGRPAESVVDGSKASPKAQAPIARRLGLAGLHSRRTRQRAVRDPGTVNAPLRVPAPPLMRAMPRGCP